MCLFGQRRRGRVLFAHAFETEFPPRCVGCGWIIGWGGCWFCGGCDKDDGDVGSVVFDGGSGEESVGYCFIEFDWFQDMVKNGFVHLVAEKSANEIDDGYR